MNHTIKYATSKELAMRAPDLIATLLAAGVGSGVGAGIGGLVGGDKSGWAGAVPGSILGASAGGMGASMLGAGPNQWEDLLSRTKTLSGPAGPNQWTSTVAKGGRAGAIAKAIAGMSALYGGAIGGSMLGYKWAK